MGWQRRQRWVGLEHGAWVSGKWRKKDGSAFGYKSWAGKEWRKKEKKNEIEKRRAVAWVSDEWRKKWIRAGQERWVGQ